MGNTQLKPIHDAVDTRWFLLDGGIVEALQDDSFASFHAKLRQLLLLLAAKTRKGKAKQKKALETLEKVVLLVEGCQHFMHHKKRLGFVDDWIDVPWLKNPYRCVKQYRPADDERMNAHLAHFKEPFTQLSRLEAQHFELAFDDFFAQDELSAWRHRLTGWQAYLEGHVDRLAIDVVADLLPSYEALQKLHEAATVACDWASLRYRAPNQHVLEDYLAWELVDGYAAANPFEIVADLFRSRHYGAIRASILALYGVAPAEASVAFVATDAVRSSLRHVLEAGWLLLQTDYLPADWFDADQIVFLRCPVAEGELQGWQPSSLTLEEQHDLRKTLSQLYAGVDLRHEIYLIEDKLIAYGRIAVAERLPDDERATRDRLLKILDVLTLIALDLWQGKGSS